MLFSFTSLTPHVVLGVLMITFALLALLFQAIRISKTYRTNKPLDNVLWTFEFLTIIAVVICSLVQVGLYSGYIPADSPGCLPHIAPYGVVASSVDPAKYAVTPVATYPATTYPAAVLAYKNSPNGFTTGFFAWDGLVVTILNADAFELAAGTPVGNSWVFEDLNVAVVR